MIAKRTESDRDIRPARALWVALMFMRQLARWEIIATYDNPLDAARACVSAFLPHWRDIEAQARTLRALCEHPNFVDFADDGIDATMITRAARLLSESIEAQNENVERLLDEPAAGDDVRVVGVVNTERLQLVTSTNQETHADQLFVGSLHTTLAKIREQTGHGVTAQGFDDAVVALLLMHPDEEPPDTPLEQELADRLFGRTMAATLYRIYERTGGLVSERGLEDAALFASKAREAIAAKLGIVLDPMDDASTEGETAQVIPFQRSDDDDDDGDRGEP